MSTISIVHRHDLFEIRFNELFVISIRKYCGESQYPRDVKYDSLPDKVKEELFLAMSDIDTE